jgi:hypothetical protein
MRRRFQKLTLALSFGASGRNLRSEKAQAGRLKHLSEPALRPSGRATRYPRLRVGRSKNRSGNAANPSGCAVGFVCGIRRFLRKVVSDSCHVVVKRLFLYLSGRGKPLLGPFSKPSSINGYRAFGRGCRKASSERRNAVIIGVLKRTEFVSNFGWLRYSVAAAFGKGEARTFG